MVSVTQPRLDDVKKMTVETRIIPPENQCGSKDYIVESTIEENGIAAVFRGYGETINSAVSDLIDSILKGNL